MGLGTLYVRGFAGRNPRRDERTAGSGACIRILSGYLCCPEFPASFLVDASDQCSDLCIDRSEHRNIHEFVPSAFEESWLGNVEALAESLAESTLTSPRQPLIITSPVGLRADLGFHAEWLRDEP